MTEETRNKSSNAETTRMSRRAMLALSSGAVVAVSGCPSRNGKTVDATGDAPSSGPTETDESTDRAGSTAQTPGGSPTATEPSYTGTDVDEVDGLSVASQYGVLQGEDEHCKVSEGVLQSLGVSVGEQIRIGCDDCGDYPSGLYTVVGGISDSATIELSDAGAGRLGFSEDDEVWVDSRVPHPKYQTVSEAREHSEFVEVMDDSGGSDLVACAPHGGYIEHPTHELSRYVSDALDATEWTCAGYNSGGGAFDRWHITSTDISRDSFPGLDRIADRGFTHAVSFHGFTGDGIKVSGLADKADREAMREAIADRVGERYEVTVANPAGPYGGASAGNFVNWLTENDTGIQLEIEWDARQDDWESIARAVVDFYEPRLGRTSTTTGTSR